MQSQATRRTLKPTNTHNKKNAQTHEYRGQLGANLGQLGSNLASNWANLGSTWIQLSTHIPTWGQVGPLWDQHDTKIGSSILTWSKCVRTYYLQIRHALWHFILGWVVGAATRGGKLWQVGIKYVHVKPNLAQVGILVTSCPTWAQLGPTRPNSAPTWPRRSSNVVPTWLILAPTWPNLAPSWPKMAPT